MAPRLSRCSGNEEAASRRWSRTTSEPTASAPRDGTRRLRQNVRLRVVRKPEEREERLAGQPSKPDSASASVTGIRARSAGTKCSPGGASTPALARRRSRRARCSGVCGIVYAATALSISRWIVRASAGSNRQSNSPSTAAYSSQPSGSGCPCSIPFRPVHRIREDLVEIP